MTTRQRNLSVIRRTHWIIAACVVVVLLGLGGIGVLMARGSNNQAPSSQASGFSQGFCPYVPWDVLVRVFDSTNELRAYLGLNRLRWDPQLSCDAVLHSQVMNYTNTLSHTDLNALIHDPYHQGYSSLGENVLVGPVSLTGQQIEDAFVSSPGHLANILGNWTSVGMGIVYGTIGKLWVTVTFGRDF
jgi:uncharacterized protein YkwD